jgi:hypothetical protein
MKIYKLIPVLVVVASMGLVNCRKTTVTLYKTAQDNVFFNFSDTADDKDSLVYTFAFTPTKVADTILLPVSISGERSTHDMSFKVAVTDSGTTAVEGLHYAPLLDSYIIPAGAGAVYVPVILYNKDSLLSVRSVGLNLHLVATSDLGTQLADVITARIVFSSKPEKPVWWDFFLSSYSDPKFKLFLIAVGYLPSFPADQSQFGYLAPEALYDRGLMDALINDPVGWVAANPDKGYIVQVQPDGVSFAFYNTLTPDNRLTGTIINGSYYFSDGNGGTVTPD